MRSTVYFKWFMDSLTEVQQLEYRQSSINMQKDWYISWLEKFFDGAEYRKSLLEKL